MKQKLKNKKGFTLVELLVVVAIIGVLVAVSIPLYMGATAKAADAVDLANERAAKAVAYVAYLTEDSEATGTKYYSVEDGTIASDTPSPYGAAKGNEKNVLVIDFDETPPSVTWTPGAGADAGAGG